VQSRVENSCHTFFNRLLARATIRTPRDYRYEWIETADARATLQVPRCDPFKWIETAIRPVVHTVERRRVPPLVQDFGRMDHLLYTVFGGTPWPKLNVGDLLRSLTLEWVRRACPILNPLGPSQPANVALDGIWVVLLCLARAASEAGGKWGRSGAVGGVRDTTGGLPIPIRAVRVRPWGVSTVGSRCRRCFLRVVAEQPVEDCVARVCTLNPSLQRLETGATAAWFLFSRGWSRVHTSRRSVRCPAPGPIHPLGVSWINVLASQGITGYRTAPGMNSLLGTL
jgi:hypothetical protein